MVEATPLVFVYTGGVLPEYAGDSLELSLRLNSCPHILLTDATDTRKLPKSVEVLDSTDFSPPELATLVGAGFPYKHDFRNGFWLRTIERFHILNNWATESKTQTFIHSELDNLSVGIHDVVPLMRGLEGLAVPRESPDQIVASVVLVNSPGLQPFKNILNFIVLNSALGNEMEIIAAYIDAKENTDVRSLPTIGTIAQLSLGMADTRDLQSIDKFGGVFDAASVGRWLFGLDQRNLGGRTVRNLEHHPRTLGFPDRFTYSFGETAMYIDERLTGNRYRLFNLHIHSKVFRSLSRPQFARRVFFHANHMRRTIIKPATPRWVYSEAVRWARYIFLGGFFRRLKKSNIFQTGPG